MLSTLKGKINLLNMLIDTLIYLDACMGHAEEHGRKQGGNKLLRYPRSLIFRLLSVISDRFVLELPGTHYIMQLKALKVRKEGHQQQMLWIKTALKINVLT